MHCVLAAVLQSNLRLAIKERLNTPQLSHSGLFLLVYAICQICCQVLGLLHQRLCKLYVTKRLLCVGDLDEADDQIQLHADAAVLVGLLRELPAQTESLLITAARVADFTAPVLEVAELVE